MLRLLVCLLLVTFPLSVRAFYDPTSVPNNKYGIHIVDPNDIADVPQLVGEWGYVTMVLSDSDRDKTKWQEIFNELRRKHLIPIVRLATHVEGSVWTKPQKDRFYEIVNLLNALNWPTENRYVILYNEPNHANEWGGDINPEQYADYLVTFATLLKQANEDFFVLPAGLDVSAANGYGSMDAAMYLRRMIAAKPEILGLIDGWTSHSYPNPGFSGSPYSRGRGTLTSYQWELDMLTLLGLSKQLPVFITETGWMHSEGKVQIRGLLTPDQVGQNLIAAAAVWNDPRIVAVTPFLLNYQDVPFDHFSWKRLGINEFYEPYSAYQSLPKIQGQPRQKEQYTLLSDLLPSKLIIGSTYELTAQLRNDGQGILDPMDYSVTPNGTVTRAEPNETATITISLTTPSFIGPYPVNVMLKHNTQDIPIQERLINLVPPPRISANVKLGWRVTRTARNVKVLIYDHNTLLQEFAGLTVSDGFVETPGVVGIIPEKQYRVVFLIPGYLPRQVISPLHETTTQLLPKRFLPFDFSGDGAFTKDDLLPMLRLSPVSALLRFFGP